MAEENKQKIVVEEGVHLVLNEKEEVIGMLRRDPISRKHLVYMVNEATCDDIATKIIK